MSIEESIQGIFHKVLIDYGFKLPIAWVWIGVNGAFLTGKIESVKSGMRNVIIKGKSNKLRFPVNAMLVDSEGKAAHVLFKGPGQVDKVNRLRVDESPPIPPLNWPRA